MVKVIKNLMKTCMNYVENPAIASKLWKEVENDLWTYL